MEKRETQVTKSDKTATEPSECFQSEKIRQAVTLPVLGNKAPIGLLLLGTSATRQWTPEELDFLQACARHLALAVENFRLLEQVLRSQRQWMNTFDSIHDVILAHDSDYRIIKANQVVLEQLGKAAADVMGSTCEAALPHSFGRVDRMPLLRNEEATKNSPKARILASADSRWSRLLLTPSKAASRKARFTSSATLRRGVRRKKNTDCCSSRCRKEFTSPIPTGRMHRLQRCISSTCWATATAKSCWC